MAERPYDVLPGDHGNRIRVNTHGSYILRIPRLNRGTAFTHAERVELGLEGLLPERVTPLEGQLHRAYTRFLRAGSPIEKFAYLQGLRDRNTVLFYRLLSEHLDELMPIVYTPTIGEAIQEFSLWYQQVNGVFLSIDAPERIEASLRATGKSADDVDLLIVTDSEGILGIGDQGVGGILICIGKKSVYTAAAGLDPDRMVPVVLDVGTNNLSLLNDDLYLGLRHARVRGERYDAFVADFVAAAQKVFPHAMVHWEDFGADNAHRILETYRDEICTFNDDVQGTAAVVAAAIMAGVSANGERLRDQRFVISGAGTAGIGVADLLVDLLRQEGLSEEQARGLFWATTSRGLVTDDPTKRFRDFQRRYERSSVEVAAWDVEDPGRIGLSDVVANVHPTVLIGTSGQPGSFTEAIVTDMAAHVEHPLIFPLSNPTTLAEATPAHLLEWTQGRARIATGSPFAPVTLDGVTYDVAQANNALVFPGLGLGVAVSRATRVTDGMIAAAAQAVASLVQYRKEGQSLLPSVRDLRRVSATVAIAVARQAEADGVAETPLTDPVEQVFDRMWQPVYPELLYGKRRVAPEQD
ncbi:NAD-dependent malic enzyme [Propioniciclava coleopterorum]|uniref:Putative malate oxidoreductase [NAD] n=1 Tax=Propioniciclava coleopterorum TaxID=2714937 RepID=A0A6G7Y406_9ACTN|nr:NAD-dependent malic enzyme [Propioniciclava coleopterorum]QIK71378.1 NAD-dependent malic enzyme [Propioniciclava coleopterorum]